MAARALSLLAAASVAHASTPAHISKFQPDSPDSGRFARRSTPDEAAACYAARYPDLRAAFCEGDRCNARQARAHFREFGPVHKSRVRGAFAGTHEVRPTSRRERLPARRRRRAAPHGVRRMVRCCVRITPETFFVNTHAIEQTR